MGGGASKATVDGQHQSVQVKEVLQGSESALKNILVGDKILWVGDENVSKLLYNDVTAKIESSVRPLNITFVRTNTRRDRGKEIKSYDFFDVTFTSDLIGLAFLPGNPLPSDLDRQFVVPPQHHHHQQQDQQLLHQQELEEAALLTSEIRNAQYTNMQQYQHQNVHDDEEEQLQLAVAMSLSAQQANNTSNNREISNYVGNKNSTTDQENDWNQKLVAEWRQEVQDAKEILDETSISCNDTVSSVSIKYCKEVLKLNTMYNNANIGAVEMQKQQGVVEKLRDILETELGLNIFSKSIQSAIERIHLINQLTKDSIDSIEEVDYSKMCMDKTECDILLTLQMEASHALCENDIQVRAYNEAYIYLSELLNKKQDREYFSDDNNVENEFQLFAKHVSSVNNSNGENIIKNYWIGNISNSLIGQICIEIDKESMMKIIRMKEEMLQKDSQTVDLQHMLKSFKNALKDTDVNSSNIDHTTDDIGKLNNLTEGINKEEQKKLIEALKNGKKMIRLQKRTQSRIMLKPLQVINSKAHGGKSLTLPPIPRGPPPRTKKKIPPPPKTSLNSETEGKKEPGKGTDEATEDFEFL
jgi:hypothetical protein